MDICLGEYLHTPSSVALQLAPMWSLPSSVCYHADWWALTPPFHSSLAKCGQTYFLLHLS